MRCEPCGKYESNSRLTKAFFDSAVAILIFFAATHYAGAQTRTESAQIVGSSMEPSLAGLRISFQCTNCGLTSYFAGKNTGACPRCNSNSCRFEHPQLSTSYQFEPIQIKSRVDAKAKLKRGTIIVFESNAERENHSEARQITKRLIGFPGEHVAFKYGSIFIDDILWHRREIYFESATELGTWHVSQLPSKNVQITSFHVPTAGQLARADGVENSHTLAYQHRTFWPTVRSRSEPPFEHEISLDTWFNPTEHIRPAIAHHFGVRIQDFDPSASLFKIEFAYRNATILIECHPVASKNTLKATVTVKLLNVSSTDQESQELDTVGPASPITDPGSSSVLQFQIPEGTRTDIVEKDTESNPLEFAVCDNELLARFGHQFQHLPIEASLSNWQPQPRPIRISWPTSHDNQSFFVTITRGVEYRDNSISTLSAKETNHCNSNRYFVLGDNAAVSHDSRQDPELLTSATQIRGKLAASEKPKLGVAIWAHSERKKRTSTNRAND